MKMKEKTFTRTWIENTPTPNWYVLKAAGEQWDICVANGNLRGIQSLQNMIEKGWILLTICPFESGVRKLYHVGGRVGVKADESEL